MAFPSGIWRFNAWRHPHIFELSVNTKNLAGSIKEKLEQSNYFKQKLLGYRVGNTFTLYSMIVTGRTLKADYKTSKYRGTLQAELLEDGNVQMKTNITNGADGYEPSTYFEGTGELLPGTLKPNVALGGQNQEVRLCAGGIGVKALGKVGLGSVEVRDRDAEWQWNYTLVTGGGGAALGLSFPSSSSWAKVRPAPPCTDWSGTSVLMSTAGASLIAGYNKCDVLFDLPSGSSHRVDFGGWGFNLAAEVNLGTLEAGTLVENTSKPYFP